MASQKNRGEYHLENVERKTEGQCLTNNILTTTDHLAVWSQKAGLFSMISLGKISFLACLFSLWWQKVRNLWDAAGEVGGLEAEYWWEFDADCLFAVRIAWNTRSGSTVRTAIWWWRCIVRVLTHENGVDWIRNIDQWGNWCGSGGDCCATVCEQTGQTVGGAHHSCTGNAGDGVTRTRIANETNQITSWEIGGSCAVL